jgi:prepilin signal peptidase PulO-like enzyme (type II secretory pathway)
MIQTIEQNMYLQFLYYLLIVSGLIVIFFADLKYRIIPDQVLVVLLIVSFVYQMMVAPNDLINHLLSGLGMFTLFLFLVFITRGRGMGLGDVKFSFIMGLILGFPKIIPSFYLSFLTGALVSLILLLIGRKTVKSTIPFGPFLSMATIVSLLYGDNLWQILKNIWGI